MTQWYHTPQVEGSVPRADHLALATFLLLLICLLYIGVPTTPFLGLIDNLKRLTELEETHLLAWSKGHYKESNEAVHLLRCGGKARWVCAFPLGRVTVGTSTRSATTSAMTPVLWRPHCRSIIKTWSTKSKCDWTESII